MRINNLLSKSWLFFYLMMAGVVDASSAAATIISSKSKHTEEHYRSMAIASLPIIVKHTTNLQHRELVGDTADDVCSGLAQVVEEGYPVDKVTFTCDCIGALVKACDGPVCKWVAIQGGYTLHCRSDNFFTSPDDKVWWYVSMRADFDNRGLYQIKQRATYVKGRKYVHYRQFREEFTLYYNQENDDDPPCGMGLQPSGHILNSCQSCNISPLSTENKTCYEIDCSNVNIGYITKPVYIDELVDTCTVDTVEDFSMEPHAATIGFLQDNVKEIYPDGGQACIIALGSLFNDQEDLNCTCVPSKSPEEDENAVFVSCRYPCVYGPEVEEDTDDRVEYVEYLEGLYITGTFGVPFSGSWEWTQRRYVYVNARNETEIFRNMPNPAVGLKPDLCWASQNDILCESCGYTTWGSSKVLLNCTNLPNGLLLDYTTEGSTDIGDWETTPFVARWRGDSICLRNITSDDLNTIITNEEDDSSILLPTPSPSSSENIESTQQPTTDSSSMNNSKEPTTESPPPPPPTMTPQPSSNGPNSNKTSPPEQPTAVPTVPTISGTYSLVRCSSANVFLTGFMSVLIVAIL